MRPAIEVTDADREAAASGYYAWCSGNPVIPNRMIEGRVDDHSMVQAFARHRLAEREAVVKWLREQDGHGYDDMRANCIEAGEHLK